MLGGDGRELHRHEPLKGVALEAFIPRHGGGRQNAIAGLDIGFVGSLQCHGDAGRVRGFETVLDSHSFGLRLGFGGACDGDIPPTNPNTAGPCPGGQLPGSGRGVLRLFLPHLACAAPLAIDAVGIDLAAAALIFTEHTIPPLCKSVSELDTDLSSVTARPERCSGRWPLCHTCQRSQSELCRRQRNKAPAHRPDPARRQSPQRTP